MLIKLWYIFSIFAIIFVTKLYGRIDIPLLILLANFLLYISQTKTVKVPKQLLTVLIPIFIFTLYAGIITIIYGASEMVWFLKFGRTMLMFVLIYYTYYLISKEINYNEFVKIFCFAALIHSLIVILCVLYTPLALKIYSFTGAVPRGPIWSRSPGLTWSFNSTAIVHLTALWFVLRDFSKGKILKSLIFIIIIGTSLIFLGRFVSYIGILLILFFLIVQRPKRIIWVALFFFMLISMNNYIYSLDYDESSKIGRMVLNYRHIASPLNNLGNDTGRGAVEQYEDIGKEHFYLTDKWYVLLFGNSQSGHIGLFWQDNDGGETHSDLGVVNSVNANGIILTLLLYLFYLSFILRSKKGDWKTVLFIVILTLSLTFKETGFFTSHATQLLCFILYYQLFNSSEKKGNLPKSLKQ